MLLLSNDDVAHVLTMDMAIQALEEAYIQLARGEAVSRPRIDVQIPTRDPSRTYVWGTMEGGSSASGYFAIRMKSDVFHEREEGGVRLSEKYCVRPGLYCGLILLTDVLTGEPLAIMPDGYLQHVRLGADGGIGAKYMAREEAEVVGMLGSGGMARTYLEAFCRTRRIKRVQVYSPTREHREAYAREMAERFGVDAVPVDDPRQAHQGADILASCTNSNEPVVIGRWLEPGTHITNVRMGREQDEETVRRIDVALRLGAPPAPLGHPELFFDHPGLRGADLTYAAAPPGGAPPLQGLLQVSSEERRRPPLSPPRERIVFLKDLVEGKVKGRRSPEEITHSERGTVQGVQFYAVAAKVYEGAKQQGLGRQLPAEWFLQDIPD